MGCASSKALLQPQQMPLETDDAALPPKDLVGHQEQEVPTCAGTATAVRVPIPPELLSWDEEDRLRSVSELGLINKAPDARFDEISCLMRSLFDVALAAVSLVENLRITFYAKAGDAPVTCVPRVPEAFCARIIVPHVPQMLIVEDALEDSRFRDATIVTGPPYVRFYCGAPLVSSDSGHRYGALFLMDTKPRQFTAEMYAMLGHFAEVITREMERDKMMRWQQQTLQAAAAERTALLRSIDAFSEAMVLCDASRPHWPLLYTNLAFEEATGISHKEAHSSAGFWALCACQQVDDEGATAAGEQRGRASADEGRSADAQAAAQAAADKQQVFRARVALRAAQQAAGQRGSGRSRVTLDFLFKPAGSAEQLRPDQPHIGIPSYIETLDADDDAASGLYFGLLQRLPAGLPVEHGAARSAQRSSGASTPMSHLAPGTPTCLAGSTPFASAKSGELLDSEGRSEPSRPATPGLHADAAAPAAPAVPVVHGFSLLHPKGMEDVVLGPLIGLGSSGRCYRGLWHGGHVAVKILDAWLTPSEAGGSKGPLGEPSAALQEALLSRSLQHPYVVTTYEYAVCREEAEEEWGARREHQQIWLLQSYANKGTLRDGIERGLLRLPDGAPNQVAILAAAHEMATAMQYIHSRGLLHGDLTSTNVLLSSSNKDSRLWIAQVADFGLAQIVDGWNASRASALGTVTHMPPELLLNNQVSPAMDVWSYAVLLWEMWAGKRAWAGMSAAKIANAVITGSNMMQVPQDAPGWLQDLMHQCFDRDPAKRPSFESVTEVLGRQVQASRVRKTE